MTGEPGGGSQGRRHPFRVGVAALAERHGGVLDVARSGPIPGLEMPDSSVPEGCDVGVEARLEAVGEGILVTAVVEAPWQGTCRRCLGPASGLVRSRTREFYGHEGDPELVYPLHGQQLDLELLARDAILLGLPQVPLCRPDCAGLCPTCGTDRNIGGCDCGRQAGDPRWAALDRLR